MQTSRAWDDLQSAFLTALSEVSSPAVTYNPSSYTSCIKVDGRPVLPPVMTAERISECRWWRQRAVEVEQRLAGATSAAAEESSEEEEDLVVISRASRSLTLSESHRGVTPANTDEKSQSAFKLLIHRLRRSLPAEATVSHGKPPHHDSLQSVNTVIENPAFAGARHLDEDSTGEDDDGEMDEEEEPLPQQRQRRDSYTLDEPSPLLQAYMDRFGDADMSFSSKLASPRAKKILPSPSELKKSRQEQLELYLGEVSTMPIKMSLIKSKVISPNMKEMQKLEENEKKAVEEESSDCEKDQSISSSVVNSVSIHMGSPLPKIRQQPVITVTQVAGEVHPTAKGLESVSEPTGSPSKGPKSDSDPITTLKTPFTARTTDSRTLPWSADSVTAAPGHTTKQIEEAVSTLAQEQQRRIQWLEEEQARQREELKRLFEDQQKELIAQIMGSIQQPQQQSNSPAKMTPLPFDIPRSASPVVPAASGFVRPISTLPCNYQFPPEALLPEMHPKFCRLTALARGYLTRRLLQTFKVQSIISSMRDTMSMALQLHQETSAKPRPVSKQDIELHRRLLQQLNKDCSAFHNIFFRLTTVEKMSILALDHEIKLHGNRDKSKERRVSAVTMARIEQKKQQLEMIKLTGSNSSSPKRRRIMALLTKDKENRGSRSRSLGSAKGKRAVATSQARRSLYNITAAVRSSANASPQSKSRLNNATPSKKISKKSNASSVPKRPWK